MRKIISACGLVGLVSLLFLSCDPNESLLTDNGNEVAIVNVKIVASANGATSARSVNGRTMLDSIIISQASLGVSRLHFQLQDQDSTDDESDSTEMEEPDSLDTDDDDGAIVEGDFIFDLFAGTSTPDFEIDSGMCKGVVLKLATLLPDSNSVFIDFETSDGTNIEFSSNNTRAFVIRTDSTLQLDGSANQVLVLLQVDALFADIDVSKATVDEDGVIRINPDSNKKLYNRVMSNFATAFKAGKGH